MALGSAKSATEQSLTGGGINTRSTMKTGGSFAHGNQFGYLGSGSYSSKFIEQQALANTADVANQAPYANDLWLDQGTDPVRLIPNISESNSVLGLQNVLFVNKGSPDLYIYINTPEGVLPSFSGALILASGESYLYEDILTSVYVHMDTNYAGSGHVYALGQTPYNHRTM